MMFHKPSGILAGVVLALTTLAGAAYGGDAATAAPGTPQPIPAGCAQIVALLEQSGGALAPEEVAKQTNTDIATVRNCTDAWRRTMKGGAHQ